MDISFYIIKHLYIKLLFFNILLGKWVIEISIRKILWFLSYCMFLFYSIKPFAMKMFMTATRTSSVWGSSTDTSRQAR